MGKRRFALLATNRESFVQLMCDMCKYAISNAKKVTLGAANNNIHHRSKFSEKTLAKRYRKEIGGDAVAPPELVA